MKLFIPHYKKLSSSIGGGNTFTKHLISNLPESIELVDNIESANVYFLIGPSTETSKEVAKAKALGKHIVLRLDGYCEDWRNSGKGTKRLFESYKMSDFVIYQSEFIGNTVLKYLKYRFGEKPNKLIYNGVDTDTFKSSGSDRASKSYVTTFYRKDPNKRFEEVLARFRDIHTADQRATLTLIGRYSTEYKDHNFGFFDDMRINYLGVLNHEQMNEVYNKNRFFLYPSFADPAPNALLEALHSGLEPVYLNNYGGSVELYMKYKEGYNFSVKRMASEYFSVLLGYE